MTAKTVFHREKKKLKKICKFLRMSEKKNDKIANVYLKRNVKLRTVIIHKRNITK